MAEYLPEMLRSGIQKDNMEHRRRYLEKITQLEIADPSLDPEQRTD